MKNVEHRLTLDLPAAYQIKVPGHLDDSWIDQDERMSLTVESDCQGRPVTSLTGSIDQAALHGLMRRLYALGLPLISVTWLECD